MKNELRRAKTMNNFLVKRRWAITKQLDEYVCEPMSRFGEVQKDLNLMHLAKSSQTSS